MAAVTVATLTARLEAQTRDFNNQIQQAEKRLGQLEVRSGSAGAGIQRMSTLMRAAASTGIALVAKELFSLGVQAEAWERRFTTVFGDAGDAVRVWADEMNERLGMSEERLRGAAAAVGDLFVPMGFARQAAADMSVQVLNLSGALSEWTGGTTSAADASNAITRAILGEREALIPLGVKISELDVQQRLAKKGMDNLTGAALQQAKAQATLELITEKSADAMTAFADGGTDAMRAQNRLKAAVDSLKVGFGQLITEAAPLISFLASLLEKVVDLFNGIDKLNVLIAEMTEEELAAAKSNDEFVTAVNAAAAAVSKFDAKALVADFGGVKEAADMASASIIGVSNALLEAASPAFKAQKAAERYRETIAQIDEDGIRTAEELLTLAEATLETQAAMDAFAADGIAAEVGALAAALGIGTDAATLLLQQLGLLDGLHVATTFSLLGMPNVRTGTKGGGGPFFQGSNHSGGMVPGPSGATVPIMAMAGERVIPAGLSSGGGGTSVNVYVAGSVVSERDLVDAVRRGLRGERIRGGSLEL